MPYFHFFSKAYTSPTSKTPMLVRPSGKDPSSSHSTPPIVPISGRSLSTGNSSSHSLQRGSIIIDQPLAITEQFHHASMFNDNYLIVSIVICLMSLIFGCFWTLILSIPAIYYSVKVSALYTMNHESASICKSRIKSNFKNTQVFHLLPLSLLSPNIGKKSTKED